MWVHFACLQVLPSRMYSILDQTHASVVVEVSHMHAHFVGGWFARKADVLRLVGDVLLDPASKQGTPLTRWLTAVDAFDHSDKATSQAIYQARIVEIGSMQHSLC